MAGIGEVRGARRVVPDAPLPRPLQAYAGEYGHPGYGTLSIAVDGDTLRPRSGRGLRFEVQGQPGITAEFELDDTGAVTRLVAQPFGIFLPKT